MKIVFNLPFAKCNFTVDLYFSYKRRKVSRKFLLILTVHHDIGFTFQHQRSNVEMIQIHNLTLAYSLLIERDHLLAFLDLSFPLCKCNPITTKQIAECLC